MVDGFPPLRLLLIGSPVSALGVLGCHMSLEKERLSSLSRSPTQPNALKLFFFVYLSECISCDRSKIKDNSSAAVPTTNMTLRARSSSLSSQGAGKGTQSSRIQDNFEVNSISSGDLLRKNIAQGTDIGKRAAKEMKNGAFVSDEVMVQLIDAELSKLGADQSWLLDGFPRTMAQARTLDRTLLEVNQPLNLVIHLNVPEDVILQRIMGKYSRATDVKARCVALM